MKRRNTINRNTRKLRTPQTIRKKNKLFMGGKTMKQMSCSPMVEKKKIVKGSCFTADILHLLKKYYNKI